jgi:hypothetical protein
VAKRGRARGKGAAKRGQAGSKDGTKSGQAEGKDAARRAPKLKAPESEYTDAEGNTLTLRGALTAATRAQYGATLTGNPLSREDAWHRAVEFLFERLAVRWTIADIPIERQRELLARFRVATPDERAWIRDVLREHCAKHFPDVQAP